MCVRNDEAETKCNYCSEWYKTHHNIRRSHSTVTAREQPVWDFNITDLKFDWDQKSHSWQYSVLEYQAKIVWKKFDICVALFVM